MAGGLEFEWPASDSAMQAPQCSLEIYSHSVLCSSEYHMVYVVSAVVDLCLRSTHNNYIDVKNLRCCLSFGDSCGGFTDV